MSVTSYHPPFPGLAWRDDVRHSKTSVRLAQSFLEKRPQPQAFEEGLDKGLCPEIERFQVAISGHG